MLKTDTITRSADRLKCAAISPRVYNRDSIKRCFVVAEKYHTPVIIRVNIHTMDAREMATVAHYLSKDFPNAQVSLMAENVSSYDEAVECVMAGYNGIAIDDALLLTNEENLPVVKEIARVARALDVSVQASVNGVADLMNGAGYQLVKASHVDMLKLMIGDLNLSNLATYQHIIHILRKETLATLTLGEDTYVTPKIMLPLTEVGISKFDVYRGYSDTIVETLAKTYAKETYKTKKLFMLEMQDLMNDTFEKELEFLAHRAGYFIKR